MKRIIYIVKMYRINEVMKRIKIKIKPVIKFFFNYRSSEKLEEYFTKNNKEIMVIVSHDCSKT